MDTTLYLLGVGRTTPHSNYNSSEFLFSFLMDSFGNLRTIETPLASRTWSIISELTNSPSSTRRLSNLVWGLLLSIGWSELRRLGRHPSSLFSVYNICNRTCQNIVLTPCRFTINRHNRSNVLLPNRSINMIVVGELMFPTPKVMNLVLIPVCGK